MRLWGPLTVLSERTPIYRGKGYSWVGKPYAGEGSEVFVTWAVYLT